METQLASRFNAVFLMIFPRKFLLIWLLPACALIHGCKDQTEIKVYRVSKAESASPSSQDSNPPMSGTETSPESTGLPQADALPPMGTGMQPGVTASPSSEITGTAPSHWGAQPLSSMRQASYLVKGDQGTTVDISLVTLAGTAGGVLENVNRWLSQLGQPEITEEQLKTIVRHVPSSLGEVSVVDLVGLPQGADATKDGRIIAGITSGDHETIFFKMRGNAPLAESQKEAFIEWIGSVKMAATTQKTSPAATESEPHITWLAPSSWKSVPPATMRYASFVLNGSSGETADVSVSVFGGDGGGDLQNVNRWRSQLGLGALDSESLKSLVLPVASQDARILTVDMTGAKGRIVAGWTSVDGKSWFFKLIGPAKLVAAKKAEFVKFLRSVKFHP